MPRSTFVCSACAYESPKWHGRCPGCGEWNAIVEEAVREPRAGSRGPGGGRLGGSAHRALGAAKPVPLAEVKAPALARFETGIGELDRVLGGGIVPGSVTLLGGEPGIGKSTLVLQLVSAWPATTLYLSAEENRLTVSEKHRG